jgi:hypothetical protein
MSTTMPLFYTQILWKSLQHSSITTKLKTDLQLQIHSVQPVPWFQTYGIPQSFGYNFRWVFDYQTAAYRISYAPAQISPFLFCHPLMKCQNQFSAFGTEKCAFWWVVCVRCAVVRYGSDGSPYKGGVVTMVLYTESGITHTDMNEFRVWDLRFCTALMLGRVG